MANQFMTGALSAAVFMQGGEKSGGPYRKDPHFALVKRLFFAGARNDGGRAPY
jgi:hypothetical protein